MKTLSECVILAVDDAEINLSILAEALGGEYEVAVATDGPTALAAFGEISGIPTTLIIDRKGRLVRRWSGYGEGMARRALDEALRER